MDLKSLGATAYRLIKQNGVQVLHTQGPRRAAGEFSPGDDQDVNSPAPPTQTVWAVVTAYTPLFGQNRSGGVGQSFENNSQNLKQGRSLSIAGQDPALKFVPEPGDTFTFAGITWSVNRVKRSAPTEAFVLEYTVGVSQ